jgi:hypothetical protein
VASQRFEKVDLVHAPVLNPSSHHTEVLPGQVDCVPSLGGVRPRPLGLTSVLFLFLVAADQRVADCSWALERQPDQAGAGFVLNAPRRLLRNGRAGYPWVGFPWRRLRCRKGWDAMRLSQGISVARRSTSGLVLPSDVPPEWQRIAEISKTMLAWPAWSQVEPLPTGDRVVTRRNALHTAAGELTSVVIALAESGGAGLEAVRLRLTAWPTRREFDISATLEVEGGRSFVTISRIDAWPPDPHVNTVARKHPALRHLPKRIDGDHVHRFADNARLGRAAFAPLANLPAAAPIEGGLRSFRDFARIVETEFRIEGFQKFNPPDWQRLI